VEQTASAKDAAPEVEVGLAELMPLTEGADGESRLLPAPDAIQPDKAEFIGASCPANPTKV
jgi:hypothetical protein